MAVMDDPVMAKLLVPDELWETIEPLLPPPKPHPQGGRPPVPNRNALTGILFVLKTGIGWEDLPQEMGCGSGMTCWRRLRDWQETGVWDELHRVLLSRLRGADQIDWSRVVVDSASVRAVFGGTQIGPNPTDRGKSGSKHHALTDGGGIPLVVRLTGANRNDVTQLLPLVDGIPPVAGKPGRPRQRPDAAQADRGYDSDPHRQALRDRRITPILARRYTEHGSGLGVTRWVIERTLSWLHQFRRLRIRYERRPDIHLAFMTAACAVICWRFIENGLC